MPVLLNEANIAILLNSPDGPVGRDLERRVHNIFEDANRYNQGELIGIDTGDLRRGMFERIDPGVNGLEGRVGTTATHPWGGHEPFAYPAFWDRNGQPWLSSALITGGVRGI